MKRLVYVIEDLQTYYMERKLKRLNKKLYEMMQDKQDTEKLISFEKRVVKTREKYHSLIAGDPQA